MRWAAPSIVCPRCEQEAPPQDALGKLATCRSCGLVFDAAPRDRQVPVRRRRSEPEVDEPPKGRLRRLKIAAVVAAIAALALLVEGPGPRERGEPEPRIGPVIEVFLERYGLAERFAAYGTEACEALGAAVRRAPVCVEPGAERRMLQALDEIARRPDFGAGVCRATLAESETMLRQLGCVRPEAGR